MRSRARPIRLAVLGIVGLAIVWGVLLAVSMVHARSQLDAGRKLVERARKNVDVAAITNGTPLPDLARAGTDFRDAHGKLHSILTWPARIVPVLGRQIRSADALSGTAFVVTTVAHDSVQEAQRVLKLPRTTGPQRIAFLRALGTLASTSNAHLTHLDLGPAKGLFSSLASARAEFSSRLGELRSTLTKTSAVAGAAADVLAGPRRYLVFGANNAEMRNGSGMFLSLAELRTNGGRFTLGATAPAGAVPVPSGAVPVTGDMQARWGWAGPSTGWTNLMMSPRFDASAALAVQMYAAAGRGRVDGVIAIDPMLLKGILAATGPVNVAGTRITSTSVVTDLLHDQYVRFANAPLSQRREGLDAVAHAAFDALDRGKWDAQPLVSGLVDAARGRHVMLWSRDAAEERAWQDAGIAGQIQPDTLMVSALNRGGNKLDWFLRLNASLAVKPGKDVTDVTLRLRVRNAAPAGEPHEVEGPYPGLGTVAGEYLGVIAVTVPGRAGDVTVQGLPSIGVQGSDGPGYVVGGLVKIPRGKEIDVTVRFRLSGSTGSIFVEPSARIPATSWAYQDATWTDRESRIVRW